MSVGTKHIFFKCVVYFIEWVFSSGLSRLADREFSLLPMFLPLQSSELLFFDLLLCLASCSESYYKFIIQAPHQVGIVIFICLMRTPGWSQILLNPLNHSYQTIRWWGPDLRNLSLDLRLFVHGTDGLPWGAWLNNAKRIKLLLVKCNSCVLPFLKWLRHVWSASISTFEKWLAMETGVIAQLVKCLPCNPKGQSSIPRTHAKKPWEAFVNPSMG